MPPIPPLPPQLLARLAAANHLPDPLPAEPMHLFREWFDEAHHAKQQPNPNAMCLATVGENGHPAARIVLCRGMSLDSGYLVFFTNYRGRKGREVAAHPFASATFHWDHAERQVRIEGRVVQSPAAESDAYFDSRPWESRLSAWSSEQSEPLKDRDSLVTRVATVIQELKLDPDEIMAKGNAIRIPRPPHWGGFRLWASRVELWLGGPGRLHDRAEWVREVGSFKNEVFDVSPWRSTRLQP